MKSLFVLDGRVSRWTYLKVGVSLMLLKYTVEALAVWFYCGQSYTPLSFFNPLLESRSRIAESAPAWFGLAWIAWTLPFVWIAVAMSLRRSVDAGKSPWLAKLMLVPVLNIPGMLYLAAVPSKEDAFTEEREQAELASAWKAPQTEELYDAPPPSAGKGDGVKAALLGIGVGGLYAFGLTILSVFLFDSYGAALFFGTPIVAGAASAYFYNRTTRRSVGATMGQGTLMIFACLCGFLLIGLEGAICILMATPIMAPLALFGAFIGRAIAIYGATQKTHQDRGFATCLMTLPMLAFAEPYVNPTPTYEVVSAIEIDAPPQVVWDSVISFPEITRPAPWYFRAGIAMPVRARIDGTGVGATRHCEFTTGVFVEPITAWDVPHRLAFDVTEQPDPMFELTPYRHVHPPHLKNSFRSERGEFKLIPLPDGRTRLEGRTWYTLRIYPNEYWCNWTHWIVHRIHLRVLEHIKCEAELETGYGVSPYTVSFAALFSPSETDELHVGNVVDFARSPQQCLSCGFLVKSTTQTSGIDRPLGRRAALAWRPAAVQVCRPNLVLSEFS